CFLSVTAWPELLLKFPCLYSPITFLIFSFLPALVLGLAISTPPGLVVPAGGGSAQGGAQLRRRLQLVLGRDRVGLPDLGRVAPQVAVLAADLERVAVGVE